MTKRREKSPRENRLSMCGNVSAQSETLREQRRRASFLTIMASGAVKIILVIA